MRDFLERIIEAKTQRLAEAQRKRPLESLLSDRSLSAQRPRRFRLACERPETINIIAEVKMASPSMGVLREDIDPVGLALDYEMSGATAISILTEEDFFSGSLEHLVEIRKRVSLPLLRKDFIFDPYQVYESAVAGADAILLIAAALDVRQLLELRRLAEELGLDVLVEVHDPLDLEKAISSGASMIGVNNRNLRTFEVDLDVSLKLARLAPKDVILVSESGIRTRQEIELLREAGFSAFLIGEHLVRSPRPGDSLRELLGETKEPRHNGQSQDLRHHEL